MTADSNIYIYKQIHVPQLKARNACFYMIGIFLYRKHEHQPL